MSRQVGGGGGVRQHWLVAVALWKAVGKRDGVAEWGALREVVAVAVRGVMGEWGAHAATQAVGGWVVVMVAVRPTMGRGVVVAARRAMGGGVVVAAGDAKGSAALVAVVEARVEADAAGTEGTARRLRRWSKAVGASCLKAAASMAVMTPGLCLLRNAMWSSTHSVAAARSVSCLAGPHSPPRWLIR